MFDVQKHMMWLKMMLWGHDFLRKSHIMFKNESMTFTIQMYEIEIMFGVHSDSRCVNVSSDMFAGGFGPLYVVYVM